MTHLQKVVFPLRAEDFPRVVQVWEAAVRETHHFVTEADIEFWRLRLNAALNEVDFACTRDSEGKVAGFVAVADGELKMLFVHPSWRGQGFGRRLIRYAIDRLGAAVLDVYEQNEAAVGFYRCMGFEIAERSERDGTGKPYPLLHMRLRADKPTA